MRRKLRKVSGEVKHTLWQMRRHLNENLPPDEFESIAAIFRRDREEARAFIFEDGPYPSRFRKTSGTAYDLDFEDE